MQFFKYAWVHALLFLPFSCLASSSTWTDMAVNDNWTDPGNIRTLSDWVIDLGYEVDFLDNSYVMDGKIKVEKRF